MNTTFNQFESATQTTINFLKLLKVKVNNISVDNTLRNHPDWPSLLCISDSLKQWNIPNGASKIEKIKIDELPTPFIAHTPDLDNPLLIVTKVGTLDLEILRNDTKNPVSLSREEFFKDWDGVFLIAEPDETSKEIEYAINRKAYLVEKLLSFSLISLILTLCFFSLSKMSFIDSSKFFTYVQFMIMLIGVVNTSLLLWYEMDKRNPFLQKVCTGITKGNCNAILTSAKAKVFDWLSWSEVGFFYFMGGLLTIISLQFSNASIFILSWLNLLSLPYIVFSIYYQWRIAKQWCLLCLIVQGLLLLGGLNVFYNNTYRNFPSFDILDLVKTMLFYLIPIIIWYLLKPHILKLQEIKLVKRQYLRLKFNKEIFTALLQKQKEIAINPNDFVINLGRTKKDNNLIKVCNLYCGPCSDMHNKIEKIFDEDLNVNVQIIFKSPKYAGEENRKTVAHIVALYKTENQIKFREILHKWYGLKSKYYNFLLENYPIPQSLLEEQYQIVDKMEAWSQSMKIYATPTLFLNNHQIKAPYQIDDINYFLLE